MALVRSPQGPHRTSTDETTNNNNNNNNKKEQCAGVHFASALSHAPMRVAVRTVARSFGIRFPGEPIEILACLSSSWDPGISSGGFAKTSAIFLYHSFI